MLKIILLVLIIILVLFSGIYLYINPHYWIPRSSIRLNIWALTKDEKPFDLTEYEKNIQTHGKNAIPYLEKCINKYKKKGEFNKAERCRNVINSIKTNNDQQPDQNNVI